MALKMSKVGRPEQSVDAVERQGCTKSFEATGVES